MRIWGGEEGITRDRLYHVKLPLLTHVLPFSSSPLPLHVDDTIVNHGGGGVDYEGLNSSASLVKWERGGRGGVRDSSG